jgi:hypothetical protein
MFPEEMGNFPKKIWEVGSLFLGWEKPAACSALGC